MDCERGISVFQSRQGKSAAKSHNSGIMILSYQNRTGCEPCRSEILVRLLPTAARLKLIFLFEIKAQFERNYSFSAYSVYVLVQKTLCGTGRFIVKNVCSGRC